MKVTGSSLAILFVGLLLMPSCASRVAVPTGTRVAYTEKGIASWYGPDFHGRKTSSGERYNMYGRSAAHRTVPLGTIARVTHAGNGRQVVVRINDRGPFVEGRIIDLSYGAARDLAMVKEGVAAVIVEVFGNSGQNPFTASVTYAVQVGSFSDRENASKLQAELGERFGSVRIEEFKSNRHRYYRVRVGTFDKREEAALMAGKLKRSGYSSLVVSE